eukprot:6337491-Prymnesium_polylepis.2
MKGACRGSSAKICTWHGGGAGRSRLRGAGLQLLPAEVAHERRASVALRHRGDGAVRVPGPTEALSGSTQWTLKARGLAAVARNPQLTKSLQESAGATQPEQQGTCALRAQPHLHSSRPAARPGSSYTRAAPRRESQVHQRGTHRLTTVPEHAL